MLNGVFGGGSRFVTGVKLLLAGVGLYDPTFSSDLFLFGLFDCDGDRNELSAAVALALTERLTRWLRDGDDCSPTDGERPGCLKALVTVSVRPANAKYPCQWTMPVYYASTNALSLLGAERPVDNRSPGREGLEWRLKDCGRMADPQDSCWT
ncbi:hypothetical protein M8818_002216 [Zalaria obscura]|uniref:Uncharacterized protein n=1 Tax=Zalaria obscura TaxID=2024903 RepID=A0ACC3SIV1_9PEZI